MQLPLAEASIRELQESVLKQAALLRATGPVLVPAFLPESLGGPRTTPVATAGDEGVLRVGPFLRQRMEAGSKEIYLGGYAPSTSDRLLLPLVLGATDGNKAPGPPGSWGSRGRRSG